MILKKYKNNLLAIIQESGLDPNLFTAEDGSIDNDEFFIIGLRDSTVRFAARPYYGSFEQFYYRSSQFSEDFPISGQLYVHDFDALIVRFRTWLDSVISPYLDDVSTPDLWQMLEDTLSHTKYESGTPGDFGPFSAEEKIQIRLSLNDFRLLIVKNFNPNKEELKTIDARLKHLSDAVDKHNKFDWKGIAIATVINITIALSLTPEQGSQLFQLFKQIFSNVLYLLP